MTFIFEFLKNAPANEACDQENLSSKKDDKKNFMTTQNQLFFEIFEEFKSRNNFDPLTGFQL